MENNIVQVLDSAINSLNSVKSQTVKVLSDSNKKDTESRERLEAAVNKEAENKNKEKEIKEIDDILLVKKQNAEESKRIREENSALIKAKDDFMNSKNDIISNFNIRERELSEREKLLSRDRDDFKKAKEAFEKDKNEYKMKLAKSLVDNADKK